MGLREFILPDDLHLLLELIPPMFQYPDHPEWSFQADESQNMIDQFKNVQQLWPLLRVMSYVVPYIRNALRGYIWEEDGKPVGLVNTGQCGSSPYWFIGNVGVLPEYRRRGIARKLVEAAVQLSRDHGAKTVMLDVISLNTPARQLYEDLGFTLYEESTNLTYSKSEPPPEIPLPANYTIRPLGQVEWQPRYELTQHIRPESVKRFQPVEKSEFTMPPLLRLLLPLLNRGQKHARYAVLCDDQIVAIGGFSARLKPGGTNSIQVTLDPAHAALAPFLLHDLTRQVIAISPGRRISAMAVSWQSGVCEAAVAAGYEIREHMLSMAKGF